MRHTLKQVLVAWFLGNTFIAALLFITTQVIYQKTGKIFYIGFIESALSDVDAIDETVLQPKAKRK